MNNYIPKCKSCKGVGCAICKNTGVRLQNEIDEELDEYFIATNDRLHQDEEGYIDIEDE